MQRTPNDRAIAAVTRGYPASRFSRTVTTDGDEVTVTFQNLQTDEEDRYVIRDGKAEQV